MELKQPSGLSIVIPALNEEAGIEEIIQRVLATQPALAKLGLNELELIVVDDGSKDATPKIVNYHQEVVLVRHPRNMGYGAALKTGFMTARQDVLGFLDADGTYPPEKLPDLCQAIMAGADVVVGSRRSGATSQMPILRRLGNFFWSNLLSMIAGRHIADPASGMRVFRRQALEQIYPLPDGLNFTPVMSTRTAHEDLRVVEVPIPYKERVGRSKLNILRDGGRFLQTILWTALNYNPVRILGGLGIGLLALAIIIAAGIVLMRLSGITSLGPWGVTATFFAVALTVIGVNLFALGTVFNYLVSLFHKSPVRQGLFGIPILKKPLENQFWWIGLMAISIGLILGAVSIVRAFSDWPIERLWLYLLAGTMFILVGVQLLVFWIIVSVLADLSQREMLINEDLNTHRS